VLLFESACSSGEGLIAKAGLRLVCYRRDWHSKKYFGGFRDEVLERTDTGAESVIALPGSCIIAGLG
jgi:hypothetical protein